LASCDSFFIRNGTGTSVIFEPKPYRGVPVSEADGFPSQAQDALRNLDSSHQHVAVAVWYDSFDRFELLKRQLVELGLEYRLLLVEEGREVGFGHVTPWVQ
jgi:hypothetical protein